MPGAMGFDEVTDSSRPLPRPFGNYVLVERIGKGGMGAVYLAKAAGALGIAKTCVVKTLRDDHTTDDEYRTRFIDEAQVVVRLHHRNICQVFDVGAVDGAFYLAMEHIAGIDLKKLQTRAAKRLGPLPLRTSLMLLIEVLEALDYAHRLADPRTQKSYELVHRDVSPSNVMVNFEGEVKLIDFGLAQSTTKRTRTSPDIVMGKLAYMAPEQVRGESANPAFDQYATALVAYETLVGERYYAGVPRSDLATLVASGKHRPRLWDDLPDGCQRILAKALAAKPGERFTSAGDFGQAMREELIYTSGAVGYASVRADLEPFWAPEKSAYADLSARLFDVPTDPGFYRPDLKRTQTKTIAMSVQISPELSVNDDSIAPLKPEAPTEGDGIRVAPPLETPPTTDPTRHVDRRRRSDSGRSARQSRRAALLGVLAGALLSAAAISVVLLLTRSPQPPALAAPPVEKPLAANQGSPTKAAIPTAKPSVADAPIEAPTEPPAPTASTQQAEAPRTKSPPPSRRARIRRAILKRWPSAPLGQIEWLRDHCQNREACARRLATTDLRTLPLERIAKIKSELRQCRDRCVAPK